MTDAMPTIGLAPDDAWSLLSNVRRRRALVVVDEADTELHVTDVAKRIAAYELGISVDDVARHQWRRVYTTLLQRHLTTLSQAGVIDYNLDEKRIAAVSETAAVAAWVRALNAAADVDDFPPARCDARESGEPIVLE